MEIPVCLDIVQHPFSFSRFLDIRSFLPPSLPSLTCIRPRNLRFWHLYNLTNHLKWQFHLGVYMDLDYQLLHRCSLQSIDLQCVDKFYSIMILGNEKIYSINHFFVINGNRFFPNWPSSDKRNDPSDAFAMELFCLALAARRIQNKGMNFPQFSA